MKKDIVKQCVNSNCKNTFYVKYYQSHLELQCQECINKRNNE